MDTQTGSSLDVAAGQRTVAAAALWAYALAVAVASAAGVLGGLQSVLAPTMGNEAFGIGVGVLWLVAALPGLALALVAVRAGFAAQRGEGLGHAPAWAGAATGLLVTLGILWIYGAAVGTASSLDRLVAPAVLLLVAALLLGLAVFLWRGARTHRLAAAAAAGLAVFLSLLAGSQAGVGTGAAIFTLALPLTVLSALALLVLATAAGLRAASPRLRVPAALLGCAALLGLGVAGVLAMSDALGSDPFRVAGEPGLRAASLVLQDVAAILAGLAGMAAILVALLGLVVLAPALVAHGRSALAPPPRAPAPRPLEPVAVRAVRRER